MGCRKLADPVEARILRTTIASDPFAVREGLAALLRSPMIHELSEGARGGAEIVLAEVLNNIVEHGYAGEAGDITVTLRSGPVGVLVEVEDQGKAFPREELPEGRLPDIDPDKDLPEGGFGWYLIRTLVRDLSYRRIGAGNQVRFCLPREDGA